MILKHRAGFKKLKLSQIKQLPKLPILYLIDTSYFPTLYSFY